MMELQSKDHRDLLDIIDKLRLQGLSKYVDLPQIVVCGDQSAGKSSVLEAISRVPFPTKDNLCTRFATELVLRRDAVKSIKISIVPAIDRPQDERQRLAELQCEFTSDSIDFSAAIEEAKKAMGISDAKVFSKDILRVELIGPDQPHLTMVDLPGIFRAGNKDQSVADAAIVRNLVRDYMKRPRSIILAVVSAKSDFALQEVTELAKKLDPEGMRTLGLITKLDTLDAGSDSEKSWVSLARNEDVHLRLGWHLLVNRGYRDRAATSDERDNLETEFFNKGIWVSVEPRLKGVKTLVSRLSNVLRDQILDQLPSLLQEVEQGVVDARADKKRLGAPRLTFEDQRQYLLQVSQNFSSLMRSAADGIYTDPFFGSAKSEDGYAKRLRAVVQNKLSSFAHDIAEIGQTLVITDDEEQPENAQRSGHVSRSEYIKEVETTMRRSRGRELPGTFSPLLIGELFTEQCRPWEGIVMTLKQDIVDAVYLASRLVLEHVAMNDIAENVFRLINERIATCDGNAEKKIGELLHPHQSGHPITYNHYLTDNVQNAQRERTAKRVEGALKQSLGVTELTDDQSFQMTGTSLLKQYQQLIQVNMEAYASELAVDYMQGYYKVAMKRFVDDVSVLAIEECLIQKLPSMFGPATVYEMKSEDILSMTLENEDTASERKRCSEKLIAFEAASFELRRLDRHHSMTVKKQATTLKRSAPNDTSSRDSGQGQQHMGRDKVTTKPSPFESLFPPGQSPSVFGSASLGVERAKKAKTAKS